MSDDKPQRLTRKETAARDERLKAMWAEGGTCAGIAEALGFKNAQVVRVKAAKMKLPKRVKDAA